MVRNAVIFLASLLIASIPSATARQPWCSKVGWDTGYESFASFNAGSYAGCSAKCSHFKRCKSFAYGPGDCQVYDKPVKGNFVADNESTYTFYDVACIKSDTTTTTTTSTTTSTTATNRITSKTTTKVLTTMISSKMTPSTSETSAIASKTTTATIASTTTNMGKTSTTTTTSRTTTPSESAIISTYAPICDQKGYFSGPYDDNTDVISTYQTSSESRLGCYNYCNGQAGCLSYAYTTGACFLYNATLAGNFQSDASQNFYYFDMSCGAPPPTITTTTTPQPIPTEDPICDQRGYFVGPDEDTLSIEGYYDRLPASSTTKLYCYNCCKGFAGCLSYAWNVGSCTLWNTTLSYNFQPDDTSLAEFYDLSCGAPPATSADATDQAGASSAVAAVDAGAAAYTPSTNRRFEFRR